MKEDRDQQPGEHTAEQLDDARAAYAAYGQTTGGLNFRGEPMPDWDGLGDTIQAAWVAAAAAVRSRAEIEAAASGRAKGRLPAVQGVYQERLCEWMRANGLDPGDIPAGAEFEIRDGLLTVALAVRDDDGNTIPSTSHRNQVEWTMQTVPLVAPFPARP